ncbi:MAG: SAM-dependent methyltransferase [Thermodesulfobacteriota bacterium]
MSKLNDIIKTEITKKGKITFADFMQLALYHPEYGYYSSGKNEIGKEGDFYTSPYVHKAFGRVIGNFVIKSLEYIDEKKLSVLEVGAGKGFLALDVLDRIKEHDDNLYDRLNYYIVERNDTSKSNALKILGEHINKINWLSDLSDINNSEIAGVVISNELFDALSFHRLKIVNSELVEIYVSLDNEEYIEVIDMPGHKELAHYAQQTNLDFIEGQEFEINLEAENMLLQIENKLAQGFVLTIDYGFLQNELYSPDRKRGTYKCLHKHQINEAPYLNIGEQDITAHVDFSNLIRAGNKLGLNKIIYTTQGQFLVDWGILEFIESNTNQKEIQAVKNLFLPELMGDKFKVLLQEKNIADSKAFYPQSPLKISFKVL